MKLREKIPYMLLCIFVLSQLLMLLSEISNSLADSINRNVCVYVRGFISAITSILPFSIFELVILLSPIAVIFAVAYIIRSEKRIHRRFLALLSLISLLPSLYVFNLGISYNTTGIRLEYGEVGNDDLVSAARLLSERISTCAPDENEAKSLADYRENFTKNYPEICHGYGLRMINLPKLKPLLTSKLMCSIGTLAFYSYPTAEININTDIPGYMQPFTVAHEYAHLLGAASEAEANFLAYLACEASENQYIYYSGSLSALEYLLSDIRKIDTEMYTEVYKSLPQNAKDDLDASRIFFERYKGSLLYRMADRLNSAHLEISDSHGAYSYSVFSRYVTHHLLSA